MSNINHSDNLDYTRRINWDFVSRLFIGLLFILSGLAKATHFEETTLMLNNTLNCGSVAPVLVAITIFIELIIALLYISGGKLRDVSGYTLIAFTAIATVVMHNNFGDQNQLMHALKNIAIIGGILATLNGVHRRR